MCVFLKLCEVGSQHLGARKLSLDNTNGFSVGSMEPEGEEEEEGGGPRRPEEPG
jgi:hypothetical protein